MKKLSLLGSAGGNLVEPIKNFFEGKDVEIYCASDKENSDFLNDAKKLKLDAKYVPYEKNFEYFSSHDFDLVALCDYREHVQDDVLKTGKFICVHDSLLPAFKGPDALYRSFSSGIKVSGVTVFWVTEDIDSGKIIAQYPVLIENLMHFDEFKENIYKLEEILYPIVIDKVLKDEVFDSQDLLETGGCGGSCGGHCGGCSS